MSEIFNYLREGFKNIISITGVERDECSGHIGSIPGYSKSPELIDKCKTKLHGDKNKEFIKQHNDPEDSTCLSGCLFHWSERKDHLDNLLKNISSFFDEQCPNDKWCLYYGGLLGWYRDNDLIPWDTDLDILVSSKFIDNFKNKSGVVYENDDMVLKLNDDKSIIIGTFVDKKTYLYCDIFFWKDDNKNDENVYVTWMEFPKGKYLTVKRNDFFPFQKEYLNGIKIYIPSNPLINLQKRYGEDVWAKPYVKKGNEYKRS